MSYSLTYWDAVEHLRTFIGGNAAASAQRDLKRAVHSALRILAQERKWTYLYEQYQLNLNGAYSTGTIAFDYTGGSNELQVTLSDGTWPSWAARGRLWISNVAYKVDRRVSDTVLTLDSNISPTADVASGTEYTLVQTAYPLPADFKSIDTALPENGWFHTGYITPGEWLARERYSLTTGTPTKWTIMGDAKYAHTLAIHVDPAPDSDQTLVFIYQRRARELIYSGHAARENQGTVTVDGSPTSTSTVTGDGTAFESGMVGAAIRLSSTAKPPTDNLGDNPFVLDTVIKSVTDSDTLLVEDTIEADYSAVGYVITDLIDIDPSMEEAFLRCAEWQLSVIRREKNIAEKRALYMDALQAAFEADNRVFMPRHAGDGFVRQRRLADWVYSTTDG